MIFYDFSGGMESAAMLVVDRDRIRQTGAIVRWADTGKQFPEMAASIAQIEAALDLKIVAVRSEVGFSDWLFNVGPRGGSGIIKKGLPGCSRKMKRQPLMQHLKTFPGPYEVNLGFNTDEEKRERDFVARNERDWLHWRFPLIEADITRAATWEICRKAGFTILVGMYDKMGRFDCFWCGNQTPKQAQKVALHYPELAKEWMEAEAKKGHSFMPIPLKVLTSDGPLFQETGCACFGGTESMFEDEQEA